MNPSRRKMDQQQFEASVNGWEEILDGGEG